MPMECLSKCIKFIEIMTRAQKVARKRRLTLTQCFVTVCVCVCEGAAGGVAKLCA